MVLKIFLVRAGCSDVSRSSPGFVVVGSFLCAISEIKNAAANVSFAAPFFQCQVNGAFARFLHMHICLSLTRFS